MKQNFSFIYRIALMVGDALALLAAFTVAYMLRISLDPRPVANPVNASTYIMFVAALLPIWLATFMVLELYSKRVYERRPREAFRLALGAVAGVLLFVAFDFFSNEVLFPAKLIPVYAAVTSFLLLWVGRTVLRSLRLYLYDRGYGIVRVVLVGSGDATYHLADYLTSTEQSGYEVVAIVGSKASIPEGLEGLQYKSVQRAITEKNAHAIIQTDADNVVKTYNLAIENHLDYQFIPSHSALFTARHSVDLIGGFPAVTVYTTPLIGRGRLVKRTVNIVAGTIGIALSSPLMLLIVIAMKIDDFRGSVLLKQQRLSRFNKPVTIYKFRTHNRTYNGLLPEEAFEKMGRPDLLEQYRANGDRLEDDPRETSLGRLLRRTSLDELPQLFNVVRGDISLVGPRALVPRELENYEFKSLILSVKSGLTGLAQISGRRDISFEERRKLDMYYVQNWSIWLDLQILIRTVFSVITGRGAQ